MRNCRQTNREGTVIKQIQIIFLSAVLILTGTAFGQAPKSSAAASATITPQSQQPLTPHDVDLKSADGTILKASYFAAAKPGPGVLLFHQSNRTRKSWEDIARQLAAVGINALTVDTDPKTRKQWWPGALDAAFEYLISQPGVKRDVIGIGGAG
jgi:hypothetical protein